MTTLRRTHGMDGVVDLESPLWGLMSDLRDLHVQSEAVTTAP